VHSSRLRVARDPALGLTVRIFVGSVAERRGIPEPLQDDLRLAASELFSGAVEAGKGDLVTFEVSSDESGLELLVEEVQAPAAAGPADPEGWARRIDLIRALFPDAEIGDTVRIRVPAPA
jgi:hypothetical protein